MDLTCREVAGWLDEAYPPSCAEDWDNVGLLAGRLGTPVSKVYVALDLTEAILEEACAWGADMILTHHPMIFHGIKRVTDQDFIGRKLLKLAENHMAYYAMHTNFDVLAMADINERLLGLTDTQVLLETGRDSQGNAQGIGRVGSLPQPMGLGDCASYVKERFGLPSVRVFGSLDTKVRRAAVSGGSGKSMAANALAAGAQVLVTGDIDHHTGLDAVDQGLCIIDAGHYGTEYFFISHMKVQLEQRFPQLQVRGDRFRLPFADI